MRTVLDLADGRRIILASPLRGRVQAGVVCLNEVVVRQEPAVWIETAALAKALRDAHAGRLPSEIAALQEARDLYKCFGMEPSRYRPSSEALLRRVLQGKDLYRLNNAVDACNLASLSYLLPIGLYDLARVAGDITLRVGQAGEEYPGIRKGTVHLAGRLGFFDARGGFGSPTSDSLRTSVTSTTTHLVAVILATAAYDTALMRRHCEHFTALFVRYCGARPAGGGLLGGDDD
ncbi:MAG: phenylalanine--tRNA ligase beta subunit-related protein [Candidatus Krumholzibacteria bacterium]|jgi:DNA/RNA-binding domain of Phe-tRNA-synthetase-like protein|nr:phenylalanine--tRNA ligase beta subunit-related protein [Candidatus Krumholzibacteria bacterium]